MMRTVSLRRRVVAGGTLILVLLLAGLDVFVYLSLRSQLYEGIDQLLSDRARLAQQLATELTDDEIEAQLRDGLVGVEAGPPGASTRVVTPAPQAQPGIESGPIITYQVILAGGRRLTLTASASGVEASLRRLLVIEAVGTGAALALGVFAFDRAARRALRPIDDVVAAARRTAAGHSGERLRPDRTDTELGRMAGAFDEMLESLEQALDLARGAEARTRRFLADAAHQIRTPLAGVQASAEALLRGTGDEERLLANLVRETSRAGQLLGSLLQVARLDAAAPPNTRPTDVTALCRQETERAQIRSPQLQIATLGGGVTAEVNPDAIREAMANLIDNATRHARSSVEVRVERGQGEVAIEVHDDGAGLAPDMVEQAFTRFVSLDGGGGSGLGLPIARGIARAHGGDVKYESGAFLLQVPLLSPREASRPASPRR